MARVFLAALTCVGVIMLFGLVAPSLYQSWRTRHEITAPAKVLRVEIRKHRKKNGYALKTVAKFEYEVSGNTYSGDKISLFSRTGKFYKELQEAHTSGELVEVFVDPKKPSFSVYHREFSWWPFTGGLILGAGFISMGLTGLLTSSREFGSRRRTGDS